MDRINQRTFLEYQYVSDPRWSKGGNWISYTLLCPDEQKDCYQKTVYVIDRNGRAAPNMPLSSFRDVVWSAEEDTLLLWKSVPGGTELLRFDPSSGKQESLTEMPCVPAKIQPLSESRFLLTIHAGIHTYAYPEYNYCAFTELPLRPNGAGISQGRRTHLYIFDMGAGSLRPLFNKPAESVGLTELYDDHLLFTAVPVQDDPCDMPGLFYADLTDGMIQELLAPGTWYIRTLGFLNGKAVFSGSRGQEYGRYQQDGFFQIGSDGPELLAALNTSAGLNMVLSDNLVGGGQTICSRKEGIYFITTVNSESFVCLLSPDGRISGRLTRAEAVTGFDVYEGKMVYCGVKGCTLAELYLADGETCLTDHNQLEERYRLSVPVPLSVQTDENVWVGGWVMQPLDLQAQKTYPAILSIHGGPRGCYSSISGNELQFLAANQYFVLYCNPRGSDSFGNEFGELRGAYGSIDYTDLMAFTRQAVAAYPQIDPSRIGVLGGSYGGYMVNWIIGHTDFFGAAVSVRSIANWVTHECLSDIGYYYVRDQAGSSFVSGDQAALSLWENSPLKYAKNAKTPTLFIHAEEDYRCYAQEAMQMFYVLKKCGIPSRLVLFEGENHTMQTFGRPRSRIGGLQETLAWFNAYLKS
ncbi:MAG: S9 family peptidase [Lachnospiraceae bacterium]|jgi:dipeptidyl aminopeptidase/acylaminoacyl peptidase|nr:S9 family peptidase [Lachnospiraceae bacterium]